MKQFVLSLLIAVCTVCNAQTGHMKFKGVPMEGTLQSFTTKLKAKGFTPVGIQDGVSLLKGEFAGYKNCTIGAVADKSGMICKVSVIFPEMDKWGDLPPRMPTSVWAPMRPRWRTSTPTAIFSKS